jgi:hypothetical protein
VLLRVWHFPFGTRFVRGFVTEVATTFRWVGVMVGWVGFGVEVVEGFLENAVVDVGEGFVG